MTRQVVVNVEALEMLRDLRALSYKPRQERIDSILDTAIEVEQRGEWDPCCADGAYGPCGCGRGSKRTWRDVPSPTREDNNQ